MRTSTPRLVTLGFVALAACGGSSSGPGATTPSPEPVQPAGPAAPTTAEAEPTPTPSPSPSPSPTPADPGPAPAPVAATKVLVLVDARGVGLGGHDPIAYATAKRPVAGSATHTASHGGATYRFASAEHKTAFEADAAKHAPRYGGYCAYAASQNRLSPSDPKVFLIHDGALLMFTNRDFLARFQKDPAGHKQKADANWPALVETHGKAP